MGLLDSDADELKKTAAIEGTSGRKVNQSGLGALKGLSKYSKLTDKYRTKSKDPVPADVPASTVEHSRGTISKSVQHEAELSAKSVPSAPTGTLPDSVVLENNKVSAKSAQGTAIDGVSDYVIDQSDSLSAKSVQSRSDVSADGQKDHLRIGTNQPSKYTSFSGNVEDLKSVQVNGSIDLQADSNVADEPEVSAESVQVTNFESSPSPFVTGVNETLINSVHDQLGDSAKSVQHEIEPAAQDPLASGCQDLSAKSVQYEKAQDTYLTKPKKWQLGAKSVREGSEVSAKSARPAPTFENVPRASYPKPLGSKRHEIDFDGQGPSISILELSGTQRVVVDFIFNLCLYGNSLITPPVTKQMLLVGTKLKEDTALSSIKRLRAKFVIDRYAYKDGKAGWTQYRLSEQIYKELVHFQQMGGFAQFQAQVPKIQLPQRGASQTVEPQAPSWFKNLDFTKVNISPMAVNPTIRALVQEKLQPEVVQEYLNRFTSWLSTQGRVTSPLGLFCDKLKELAREGDSPVLSCMTEEEREAELSMIKQAERAKAEFELIEKAKQERAAQERALEIDRAFAEWFTTIGEGALREVVPGNAFAEFGSETHKTVARAYFEEKIWRSE